jgi:hypothetical protein
MVRILRIGRLVAGGEVVIPVAAGVSGPADGGFVGDAEQVGDDGVGRSPTRARMAACRPGVGVMPWRVSLSRRVVARIGRPGARPGNRSRPGPKDWAKAELSTGAWVRVAAS